MLLYMLRSDTVRVSRRPSPPHGAAVGLGAADAAPPGPQAPRRRPAGGGFAVASFRKPHHHRRVCNGTALVRAGYDTQCRTGGTPVHRLAAT